MNCQLTELALLAGLPETLLQQIAELAEPRQFMVGEVMFHEGARCHELLLLQKGRVQLQMYVPGHGCVPLLTLGPGQLVAWSALLGTGELTASGVCLEETHAWALPGTKLKALFADDWESGYRFMEGVANSLARRLVATRLQLLDLFTRETPSIPLQEEGHG